MTSVKQAAMNPSAEGKSPKTKKSLYQRYVDAKTSRNVKISDADLQKYTGMNREQLNAWAKDRPGVAGNQLAGKLAMGQASGFGGLETSQGYGGWGPSAEGKAKFPPAPRNETKGSDEEED
ncbi:uncharacterized protein THITE_2116361 [Thermothielavioides terrestris NRRL 8126]|uniref:Uncharacterized protein n=1 Tax=Thermothielavioides terrestris (strain ATCC 38088 / NRRL 8126) TaxID=578455 RepID=G2R5I7_THETT|nr:uncharacterized protein THITE_2116361 [Thermothielavioides terrestris NRRL 8126]AEO67478.1 hypothetical protein THITE_2116361 [Thermothielavioides terrestris NRRL 8126]